MAFDPKKFGATPVQTGFDPTAFGATAVTSPMVTPTQKPLNAFQQTDLWLAKPAFTGTQIENAGLPGLAMGAANVVKSATKTAVGFAKSANPENIGAAGGQIAGSIWDVFNANKSKADADKLQKQLEADIATRKAQGQDMTYSEAALAKIKSGPQGGMTGQKTGDAILKGAVHTLSTPAVDKALSGDFEGALKSVAEDPYQLAPYFLALKGSVEKGGALSETSAGKAIDSTIQKVASPVAKPIESALEARRVANATKDAQAVDTLAGTIVQGKVKDIPAAKRALAEIDSTEIKTYSDLKLALDEKVNNVATKLDETLLTNKEIRPLSELTVKSKVGESTVTHNYVEDAFSQLKELYTKTNDPVSFERVVQLEERAKTEGLSAKDVNDLARTYGTEIGQKAFSKAGEPLTGVTPQGLENTRTGVKATAREIFQDKVFPAADAVLTDLIRTRDLVKNVVEKVNKLDQLVTKRGFGQEVGRAVFKVIDMFSGGAVKGFVQSFIPRSGGLKIMNALDLEASLQKNLTRLQNVLDEGSSEATVLKNLQEIIDSTAVQATDQKTGK